MNKKLRRLLAICCMIFICLSTINVPTVKAAEEDTSDDSLTFVEVIEEMPSLSRATKTKSASKTIYCNDSNGNVLWSLQIAATFRYTGSSSTCTSAKAVATSNSSYWKVATPSCSRSGNKATASTVGKKYSSKGVLLQTVTKSVTISCSANGTIS